jgi:endonuclease/exonuclease/phosphatase family metal-dependent hydrolase
MVRSLGLILLTVASQLALGVTAQAETSPATDTVRVMSFNVRNRNARDGENQWGFRRHRVVGILRLQRADIFGVQEAMAEQVRDLHYELTDHDSFGQPRDGRAGGERCTIFWDRTKFARVGGATFWLSETPARPSRAWGASLRRICTWCEFRSKASGKTFFVFNTHFDHQSANARKRSAELVRQQIHDIAGPHPVVLMGDLNCDGFSLPYAALTALPAVPGSAGPLLDARVWSEHDFGPQGTWSGWDPAFIGSRIDYVFVKNAARVLQHAVVPHEWQGRVASDHFPILAEVVLHGGSDPSTRNMAHLWRMMPGAEENAGELGYFKPDFDDRKWPTISAGDAWERQGHADLDGVVFLRKKVYVPESWRNRTVQFVTAGIADMYALYVNGVKVYEAGSRKEKMWAHRTNLHLANSLLQFGADNTFVLRVTDFGGLGGLVGHPLLLTTDGRQPTHSGGSFATKVLVPKNDFGIPKDTRRAGFEIVIPGKVGDANSLVWLRIGLDCGCGDAGDKGVNYELQQATGAVVHRGVSTQKGVVWMQCQVAPGSKWQLVVSDVDTSFTGRDASDGCNFTAELKFDVGK